MIFAIQVTFSIKMVLAYPAHQIAPFAILLSSVYFVNPVSFLISALSVSHALFNALFAIPTLLAYNALQLCTYLLLLISASVVLLAV